LIIGVNGTFPGKHMLNVIGHKVPPRTLLDQRVVSLLVVQDLSNAQKPKKLLSCVGLFYYCT